MFIALGAVGVLVVGLIVVIARSALQHDDSPAPSTTIAVTPVNAVTTTVPKPTVADAPTTSTGIETSTTVSPETTAAPDTTAPLATTYAPETTAPVTTIAPGSPFPWGSTVGGIKFIEVINGEYTIRPCEVLGFDLIRSVAEEAGLSSISAIQQIADIHNGWDQCSFWGEDVWGEQHTVDIAYHPIDYGPPVNIYTHMFSAVRLDYPDPDFHYLDLPVLEDNGNLFQVSGLGGSWQFISKKNSEFGDDDLFMFLDHLLALQ